MFNLTYLFMKSKLYYAGLVSVALLTYSCSTDEDSYEVQEVKTIDFKSTPQSLLNKEFTAKRIDSTTVKVETNVTEQEGDPINPKPPR